MMNKILLMIALCFAFPAWAGAAEGVQAPVTVTLEQFKEALPAPRTEELDLAGFQALKKQGPVVVLDVRSKESFDRRHLKGSVNAPLTDLTEKNLPQLAPDKNTPVVLVCDYSFMPTRMLAMTMQAYPVLKVNGYSRIYRMNLWSSKDGNGLVTDEEQEKSLEFEGANIKAAPAAETK